MVSWWDRADGMGCVRDWGHDGALINFIIKYEPINHDGFWNSHFLREVLSEKGNHEMNFHNSFLNNSNDFWDLIVRVYGLIFVAPVDVEIITWFVFAWMPDPAGGAGRTFKSRMCTWIILRWQVGFSNKRPGWFFISMQVGLSKREAGLIWALLGRGEG